MDQQSKEDDLGPKSIGVRRLARLPGEKKVMVPAGTQLSSSTFIVSGQAEAVSKTLTHIPLTM